MANFKEVINQVTCHLEPFLWSTVSKKKPVHNSIRIFIFWFTEHWQLSDHL